MNESPERISIQKSIDDLMNEGSNDWTISLNRLSDLEPDEVSILKDQWTKIPPKRRGELVRKMKEVTEEDTLVCFDEVALLALDDDEPGVRVNAIELLWEYEHHCLVPILINMLQNDSEARVRAAAATGLGRFIYLGEIERIPSEAYLSAEKALLDVINGDDDQEIQQRALESVSFSCHQEARDQIRRAFVSNDPAWVASAMFAMGRSADMRWADMVIENLDHPVTDVKHAAIRAAGELELEEAREPLLLLLENTTQMEEELHKAIIWSLSQIGGESVRSALEFILEMAEEDDDEDEVVFLESALENLEFNEGMGFMEMFDFDLPDEDDFIEMDPDDEDNE